MTKIKDEIKIQKLKELNLKVLKIENNMYDCEDEFGYRYSLKSNKVCVLIRGVNEGILKFSSKNPYTIYNINKYIENNNVKTKLLSSEFECDKKKLKWECSCGEVFERRLSKFQQGQICCYKCSIKKLSEDKRILKEDLLKILKTFDMKPLEDISNKRIVDKIKIEDKEGYRAFVSPINLKITNGGYDFVGKSNPYSIYNINLFLQKNNSNTRCVEFHSSKTPSLFKCECGNEFERVWSTIKLLSLKCPSCSNNYVGANSTYSLIVEKHLKENNIKYTKEKTFKDCRNILPLPFDLYLKDYDILIEIDGEQHFMPVKFGGMKEEQAIENYNRQIKMDEIKNKWAKENNKKLIRIPYNDIKNDYFKTYLLKEINNT